MSRSFALAVFALAVVATIDAAPPAPQAPAPAVVRVATAVDSPDALLSPTTQLYVRWDGIAAHNDVYKKSIWGPAMAGPTGDSVRALIAKLPKLVGNSLLADPLLDGKEPGQLKANLADLKNAAKLIELVADRGVIVGAEVREPAPTLKGVGSALGGLLGGKMPGPEALIPDVQLVVVVPDSADRADVLFSTIRLALGAAEVKIEPLAAGERKGFRMVMNA